jgi:hypothetical protein
MNGEMQCFADGFIMDQASTESHQQGPGMTTAVDIIHSSTGEPFGGHDARYCKLRGDVRVSPAHHRRLRRRAAYPTPRFDFADAGLLEAATHRPATDYLAPPANAEIDAIA